MNLHVPKTTKMTCKEHQPTCQKPELTRTRIRSHPLVSIHIPTSFSRYQHVLFSTRIVTTLVAQGIVYWIIDSYETTKSLGCFDAKLAALLSETRESRLAQLQYLASPWTW